jgi:AraC-like DNA-binding protein
MTGTTVAGVDEWAAVCSESFVPLGVRGADERFRGGLLHVPLTADVGVTRVFSTASEVFRDQRLIRRSPRDDVLLSIHGAGVGYVTQAGRTAQLTRGSAALYDASQPYTLTFPGQMSELVLQLPREVLGKSSIPSAEQIPASDPTLVMLRSFLIGVVHSAGELAPALKADLAETATSLLRAELAGRQPAQASREVLFYGMKAFIQQHLSDPMLDPSLVARSHAISLRLAQLVFADHGHGLAQYIRTERLKLARTLLADQNLPVAAVAYRAGFLDPDTFTRAFKRTYGELPSALRQ